MSADMEAKNFCEPHSGEDNSREGKAGIQYHHTNMKYVDSAIPT
jgi:hypothetical protein